MEWFEDLLRSLVGSITGRPIPRRDPRWRSARLRHLAREPQCQACGTTSNLQVHHIIPVHIDRTQELTPENMITLCETPGPGGCHLKHGHRGRWASYDPHIRDTCRRLRDGHA